MNIYRLTRAIKCLDEAASLTPEKKERAAIVALAKQARKLLRKRGVFLGEEPVAEQPSRSMFRQMTGR